MEVSIRTARVDDATALAAIRSRSRSEPDNGDFVHHLGIPSGDDYFCLAAEIDGVVVGYLSGGGSRDDDRKSYGEVYELAADPRDGGPSALRALARAAIVTLTRAQYGGVIAWVDTDDGLLSEAFDAVGLLLDDRCLERRAGRRRLETELPSDERA
ncbi:MAG TPA: hypothetical protein VG368_05570 [Acidimicrobiales bacterium]|nr:hypothetical protein [Acidimicrobiales bacterium]